MLGGIDIERKRKKERHRQTERQVQIAFSSTLSPNPKLPSCKTRIVCGACVCGKRKRQSSKTVPLQHNNVLHMLAETPQCSYNCEEQKDTHVRVTENTAIHKVDKHYQRQ